MLRRRPWRIAPLDIALAAALSLLSVVVALLLQPEGATPFDGLGLALILLATAATALRRVRPVATLAASAIGTSAYLTLAYAYGPVLLSVALGVYTVARLGPTRKAVLLSAATLAVLLVHLFTNEAALPGAFGLIPATAWVAVPFTIGSARRLVLEAGIRERAASEQRRLDEERLRLAHEVHDIVGHGLAAIQMQADIALHLKEAKPEQAQAALEVIRRASAAALAELRATLSTIAPAGGADEAGSRAPTPGLDRIEELCRRVRQAGVAVELRWSGQRRRVAPEVDVAAYRLVQESLTNVAKHASDRQALVNILYTPEAIELTVTNRHHGVGMAEGFGIAGMRRRVLGLGGSLEVAEDAGEFRVHAVIPTTD